MKRCQRLANDKNKQSNRRKTANNNKSTKEKLPNEVWKRLALGLAWCTKERENANVFVYDLACLWCGCCRKILEMSTECNKKKKVETFWFSKWFRVSIAIVVSCIWFRSMCFFRFEFFFFVHTFSTSFSMHSLAIGCTHAKLLTPLLYTVIIFTVDRERTHTHTKHWKRSQSTKGHHRITQRTKKKPHHLLPWTRPT